MPTNVRVLSPEDKQETQDSLVLSATNVDDELRGMECFLKWQEECRKYYKKNLSALQYTFSSILSSGFGLFIVKKEGTRKYKGKKICLYILLRASAIIDRGKSIIIYKFFSSLQNIDLCVRSKEFSWGKLPLKWQFWRISTQFLSICKGNCHFSNNST